MLSRPIITTNGKDTQIRIYDEDSGVLTELEDSAAGTFKATYDADGNILEKTLPGGLIATTTYDDAGVPTRLSYAKHPQEPEEVEVPDPIAAYSFEEGEGSVLNDSAEGNHDGTISGATWSEAGKYGGALSFDGTDDVVTVPDHADLDLTDSFTLEAWVRPDPSAAISQNPISKVDYAASSVGYALRSSYAGNPAGHAKSSAGAINAIAEDPLPEKEWSHLAFTSDGTTLRLYVDGELVKTAAAKVPPATSADLKLGYGKALGVDGYFDGLLDEVRLYGEPLSEEQIRESAGIESEDCEESCPWLEFSVEESIHGQWLEQQSTLSTQQYAYDKAGRLVQVEDTPQGEGCTTRTYTFDANSNRTKLITREPGEGGACDTESKGAVQEYSYDTGDRLTGEGIAYDDFGRTTSLPGKYAGGATLTSSFYANDLVHSQTQGAITNAYELDASLRQRQRTRSGAKEETETYHYAGPSDSPTWIERGEEWTRYIAGIEGELAAIEDSEEGTTLQLSDLHGDIVATASLDPGATEPLQTFEFDEYGNPKQEAADLKFGWLGAKQRRTEFPSGIVQMGVRSYIPALGRFISVDPVRGGSANAYEYAMGDPVNKFDLTGECVMVRGRCAKGSNAWLKKAARKANKQGMVKVKFRNRKAAEGFARYLQSAPRFLERMQAKVGKWQAEDIREMKKRAAEAAAKEQRGTIDQNANACGWIGWGAGTAATGLALSPATGGASFILGVFATGTGLGSLTGAC